MTQESGREKYGDGEGRQRARREIQQRNRYERKTNSPISCSQVGFIYFVRNRYIIYKKNQSDFFSMQKVGPIFYIIQKVGPILCVQKRIGSTFCIKKFAPTCCSCLKSERILIPMSDQFFFSEISPVEKCPEKIGH